MMPLSADASVDASVAVLALEPLESPVGVSWIMPQPAVTTIAATTSAGMLTDEYRM